jgi:serine/threonine protein kinase
MQSIPPRSPLDALPGYRALRGLRTRGLPRELLAVREGPARFQQLCSVRLAPVDDLPCAHALSQEAAILTQLHHPNILPAYESHCAHGWLTLVLAFYGAFPVDSVAAAAGPRAEPLDIQAIMFVAYAVFDALAHAHGKKDRDGNPLVHGDMHPANVLVRSTGHVVLRGFRGAGPLPMVQSDPHRDLVPGPYAAPELFVGEPTSTLSDVYGAAALVWHLLVGRPLGRGETPSFATIRPDLSPEVAAVLAVCLSSDPGHRRLLASTVAATVGKTVNVHAGRDCLERLYCMVLRGLPPKVRALCQGSMPPAMESNVAPIPQQPPTHDGTPSPLPDLDYGDEKTHRTEELDGISTVNDKGIAQDLLAELLAHDRAEQSSAVEAETGAQVPFDLCSRSTSYGIATSAVAPVSEEPPSDRRAPHSLAPVGHDLEQQPSAPKGLRLWHVAVGMAVLSILPFSWIVGHYAARSQPSSSDASLARTDLVSTSRTASPSAPGVEDHPSDPVRPPAPPSAEHAAPLAPSFAGRSAKPRAPSLAAKPAAPLAAAESAAVPSSAAESSPPAPSSAAEPVTSTAPVASIPAIPFYQSRLTVNGPPHGIVFVNGKPAGRTGEAIVTHVCGLRFVRVAAAPEESKADGFRWLSKGQTVKLPCGGSVSAQPKIEELPAETESDAGPE